MCDDKNQNYVYKIVLYLCVEVVHVCCVAPVLFCSVCCTCVVMFSVFCIVEVYVCVHIVCVCVYIVCVYVCVYPVEVS